MQTSPMPNDPRDLMSCCLYFTANELARCVTRMAERRFGALGLAPSHAFLLNLAVARPGIAQKELAEELRLAPSTVSRFVDALERRGLVERKGEGRNSLIHPTRQGTDLQPAVMEAWKGLYADYSAILGEKPGQDLTQTIHQAACLLADSC